MHGGVLHLNEEDMWQHKEGDPKAWDILLTLKRHPDYDWVVNSLYG
jgi:hypothetical protein